MATEQFKLEPSFPDPGPLPEEMETSTELMPRQEVSLSEEAVLLAGHLGRITAKLEDELTQLEQLGISTAQMIDAVRPTDQASFDELFVRMEDGKTFLERAEIFIDPWKQMFYRPYTRVLERTKQIIGRPTQAMTEAKGRRIQFEREVKAAQDRETLRLQAEQRKREEEQRLATAVQAEEIGMSPAAVESILTQPSVAPMPVAAPMVSRPQGMRKLPENWAAEVFDMKAFWQFCKAQKEIPPWLVIDMPTLNREARTHRATLTNRIPGVRGVNRNA